MPSQQWKKRELAIGKRFGVQRIPSMGKALPDLRVPPGEQRAHGGLAIESKTWSGIPPRFWEALEQARRNASDGEIPVAVISESNKVRGRKPRFAVVLDFDAFADLFGPEAEAAIGSIAGEDTDA